MELSNGFYYGYDGPKVVTTGDVMIIGKGENDMSKDTVRLSQERYEVLIETEMRARALVEGVGADRDYIKDLQLLCESLKPIEPEYVPLVSREELNEICDGYSFLGGMRTAIVLALRKMGDELHESDNCIAADLVWARARGEEKYTEEKYTEAKYTEAKAKRND